MMAYLLRRLLATIPVMLVVALFVFALLHLSPGDPAAVIAGDYASPEDIERIRHKLGLDAPLHKQLAIWLWQVVRGDLGTSIFSNLPVSKLIGQRLEPTLTLTACTMLFAVLLAVPMGVVAAWQAGTWVDRAVMVFAVLGFSLPVFWLGFLFIFGFALKLQILPVQGYVSLSEGLWPCLRHLGAAQPHPRHGLHGADCPHDPCQHAGGITRGLYPHRPREGPEAERRFACGTP